MEEQPILIFDTYAGLCNQMFDIRAAIEFCKKYCYMFSFRNASFRNPKHLSQWFDVPFEQLFDNQIFEKYTNYIPIYSLKMTRENTLNYDSSKKALELFSENGNLENQINNTNKKYIILKQFWSLYKEYHDPENIYHQLLPCKKIQNLFQTIKQKLPDKYNYIHYRYEEDFNQHFKIKNPVKLTQIIEEYKFQENDYLIYIAASGIENLGKKQLDKPLSQYKNIILKENQLKLNFEEAAFLDFMIGKHAQEIVGHEKSSFSLLLNSAHKTNNHYNRQFTK